MPKLTKQQKIDAFNPSAIGLHNGHLYSLPFTVKECEAIVIPVPWEVTACYGDGSSKAPQAILTASDQIDLLDPAFPNAWKAGVGMEPIDKEIIKINNNLKKKAITCIEHLEQGGKVTDKKLKNLYDQVNSGGEKLNYWLKKKSLNYLSQGYKVIALGGDHSSTLGLIQALAEAKPSFSVLHFDAHADVRIDFEGFKYSHASALHNVNQTKGVASITQVGIRDYCEEEEAYIKNSNGKITLFSNHDIRNQMFAGKTWDGICAEIISTLQENVYISFDIDALNPTLCPHTGTPVPGGFEMEECYYLLEMLLKHNKKIIGADLTEVSPGENEWDANVGARILWKIANIINASSK